MSQELASERTSEWDIATACDIKLGRLFEDEGRAAYFIDVDAEAIASTLSAMGPDSTGKLLFEIVDEDSPDLMGEFPWRAGGVALPPDKNGQAAVLIATPSIYTAEAASEIMQTGSVHELRHTIDHTDSEVMEEQARSIRNLNKKAKELCASLTSFGALAGLAVSEALKFDTPASLALMSGCALVGLIRAWDVADTKAFAFWFESPLEQRAYEADKKADTFPTMVSFKPH